MGEFVQNRVFGRRSARFVDSAVGAIPFAIFRKVHELVKNCVYSWRPAPVVIFALGSPVFSDFKQSTRVCTKQRFQRDIRTFCQFVTGRTTFKPFLANCTSLYKTAFSARDQHVLSFLHRAHHFLAVFSKVQEFVQNSVFSPRLARFVTFAVGALLLSHF